MATAGGQEALSHWLMYLESRCVAARVSLSLARGLETLATHLKIAFFLSHSLILKSLPHPLPPCSFTFPLISLLTYSPTHCLLNLGWGAW